MRYQIVLFTLNSVMAMSQNDSLKRYYRDTTDIFFCKLQLLDEYLLQIPSSYKSELKTNPNAKLEDVKSTIRYLDSVTQLQNHLLWESNSKGFFLTEYSDSIYNNQKYNWLKAYYPIRNIKRNSCDYFGCNGCKQLSILIAKADELFDLKKYEHAQMLYKRSLLFIGTNSTHPNYYHITERIQELEELFAE